MLEKHIIRFICTFFICFCLIGCNKGIDNEGEEQGSESLDDGALDKSQKSEEETKGQEKFENTEDGSIVEGVKKEDDEKIASFPTMDVPKKLLENYCEKGILSDKRIAENDENYCNIILNENNKIEFYTVGETRESLPIVWKYVLEETSWNREEVTWLAGLEKEIDQKRITVFLGADHNYYAWYVDHKEMSHLVKHTGDAFAEIRIPDWDKTAERDFYMIPGRVAVLENGNIVMANKAKECYVYSKEDGGILSHFSCGWYKSLCVSGNHIFILNQENRSALHYDAKQEKFLPEISGNFDATAMFFVQGDQLYGCYPGGIYQADFNGTHFQKILDAGLFHFSKKNGILLELFVVGDSFYIVYGENNGTIMKYHPAERKEKSNSLTVYSLEANPIVIDMIAAFRLQYPDIEIVYETGEGSEGSISFSDRIRALNARILAGDGPDIFMMDGMPTKSYIDKALLADLTPMLDGEEKDLLPNIVETYTKNGSVFMLPMRIMIPVIMTSGQDHEFFSTLSALADYSEENGGGVLGNACSCAYYFEMLYYNFQSDFVTADGEINREAVKEFLRLTKRLCESEQVFGSEKQKRDDYLGGTGNLFLFAGGGSELMFRNVQGIYELSFSPAVVEHRGGEILGNGGLFLPNGLVAVNRASGNSELASLFVKTVFSYELQNLDGEFVGFPVHEKVLAEEAQIDISHIVSTYFLADGTNFEARNFNQKEAEEMIQIVREARVSQTVDRVIFEVIEDEALPYLDGGNDLEECTDRIVNRLQLYLYE